MPSAKPHPSPRTSRLAAIDGLRGLLAVVVVAWHICSPFGLSWMLLCANAAVWMFFLLSGFVLTRGWDGRVGVFLIRRFLRLWPVYALCLGGGYLIAGVHPVWSEFFWYPLIGPNSTPKIDPPIWSLFIEAWAMPLMPLIVWAGSANRTRAALCIAMLVIATLMVPQLIFIALFVLGAFLSRKDFRNRFLEAALPQWLGRVSYSLYLSHVPVLTLAVRLFGPWGGVAAIPMVCLTAWLLWWGVERPSIWVSRWVSRAANGRFAGRYALANARSARLG